MEDIIIVQKQLLKTNTIEKLNNVKNEISKNHDALRDEMNILSRKLDYKDIEGFKLLCSDPRTIELKELNTINNNINNIVNDVNNGKCIMNGLYKDKYLCDIVKEYNLYYKDIYGMDNTVQDNTVKNKIDDALHSINVNDVLYYVKDDEVHARLDLKLNKFDSYRDCPRDIKNFDKLFEFLKN